MNAAKSYIEPNALVHNTAKAAAETSSFFSSLMEQSTDVVAVLGTGGKLVYITPSVKKILGYTEAEIMHLNLFSMVHSRDAAVLNKLMRRAISNPGVAVTGPSARILHRNGSWRWISTTITNMQQDAVVNGIIVNIHDLAERKKVQLKLKQVNRLYAFINQINHAIAHIKEEQSLFNEVCRIAVDTGKFKMAWIGLLNEPNRKINLMASCNANKEDILLFTDYTYEASGPTEKVVQGLSYFTVGDIAQEPVSGWTTHVTSHGFKSLTALPIKKLGKVYGILYIYAAKTNFFSSKEIDLLQKASYDISFSLDVSEKEKLRLQANEKLQNSELRLKQALEIAQMGNYEFDFATGISIWSDEMLKIYGLSPQEKEQSYKMWLSFIHPEDLFEILNIMEVEKDTTDKAPLYYRIKRKDGTIRRLYSKTDTDFNSEGKAIGLYGVVYDVTDSKLAEEQLKSERNLLRTLIDNLPDGIYFKDTACRKVISNKFDYNMLGRATEAEVLGKTDLELLPANEAEVCYNHDTAVINTGKPLVDFEEYFLLENKKLLWLLTTKLPLRNDNGEIIGLLGISRDITERKKTEQQLKESEEFNKGILASLTTHIAVIDRNGTIITTNKAWNDYAMENDATSLERVAAGVNYFEVCRQSICLGISVAGQTLNGIMAVFSKEIQTFELEYECHSPGKYRWFSLNVSNFGEDGSKVVISHQDITKIKIAEQQVIQSEWRLRDAQTVAKIGSWDADFNNFSLLWSEEMYRIFELNPGELMNYNTFLQLVHPDDQQQVHSAFKNSSSENTYYTTEHRIITPKNNVKIVEERWRIYKNKEGTILRAAGTLQDITERKKADELIVQSEANLNAVIENTDAFIYSLDRNLNYVTFNSGLKNSLKEFYNIEVKIGDSIFDVTQKAEPWHLDEWKAIYSRALNGEAIKFERTHKIEEFYRYTSFAVYPLWLNSNVIGLSCFINDVTKEKQAESERNRMIEDTIKRNKDLEQFSYIVSHNLRAPLANIIGIANELNNEIEEPEVKSLFLHELSSNAKRLDGVISDLNTILRAKAPLSEKKETVNLPELVANIQASIQNLIYEEQVQIKTDFTEANELFTLKSYLHSIFFNLISNSIKYRQPDVAPVIEINAMRMHSKIVITFADNGTGIDLAKKGGQLFGLYKRFNHNIEGKGLGLFMVKTQVETLGGKINVWSEINKGTQFKIEFAC